MSTSADDRQFWAYAATFGGAWGALEITVGSFIHALKLPFGGVLLAACGAAWLLALRVVYPHRGIVLASGLVCAGVKLLSPSTAMLGPATGILIESTLVELSCLPFGANTWAATTGGSLAALWAFSQKLLTQWLLFGGRLFALYDELLKRAEQWMRLPKGAGYGAVGLFAVTLAVLGAVGANAGLRAGRRVVARRAR